MNWKKEAVDKLRTLEARRASITHTAEEIARIDGEMMAIRSALKGGTPVRGGGSGYEDRLLSLIMKKDELKTAQQLSIRWVKLIDRVLGELKPEERHILDRFYIHPAKGNAERLAEELDCSQATIYRYRDYALLSFTRRLYGWTEM